MVYLQAVVICLSLALSGAKVYTPREVINSLHLSDANVQDAYDGLNAKRDKLLNVKDLDIFYHHKDTGFAKEKFMELLDTKDRNGIIELEELAAFLFQQPVTNAIWECTYIHSESLREYCFADQILTYVLLVIDNDAIAGVYAELLKNTQADKVVKASDLTYLGKLIPLFKTAEQENFMLEIGGDDGEITYDDFKEYLVQEDLQDDIRRCRKSISGIKGVYDNMCVIREVADYTMTDLSELEVALLYKFYHSNNDKGIFSTDLLKSKICSKEVAKKFIALMDKTGDESVSYGEFRAYLKSHSVRMQLEKECSEVHTSQHDEMSCYKVKVLDLVIQSHTPIWMKTIDLDTTILFEELDITDDGLISAEDDLVRGKSWSHKVANKMVDEMHGHDDDADVSLEEFLEYLGYPNMVYTLNNCLSIKKRSDRSSCYESELKDIFPVILGELQVKAFFNYIDTDGDGRIKRKEVEAKGIKEDDADNFLFEMGMGDMEISYLEFSWFVRQKSLSHIFDRTPPNKAPRALLPILMKYIDEVMSEHDTQELFKMLDNDGNYELELSDFAGNREDVIHLIASVKSIGNDQDSTVNFYEFWLHLNSPMDHPRKTQLEEKCTKLFKKQADELACYAKTISTVK